MPRALTTLLTFHWAAAFALLSMACVMGGSGAAQALSMLGLAQTGLLDGGSAAATLLSPAAAVCAVLFFWAFVTSVLGDPEAEGSDVVAIAFASAALLVCLLMICGSVTFVAGLYPAVAVHLAALLASYLAIQAERFAAVRSAAPGENDIRAAARVMALGAAHVSMLSRLSGRADSNFGEGR
jgi:hypothetical protein